MIHAEAILEPLAAWQPAGAGPHSLTTAIGANGSLTLSADRCDAFSSKLLEMTVLSGLARPFTPADLTQRAVQTASRITGLLEPLRVYEVDATAGVALLRSATPTDRGGQAAYYELTLTGMNAAKLQRFSVTKGGSRRSATPFALTHEVIAKLADDLRCD